MSAGPIVPLDLNNNPELAELVSDKSVGDWITISGPIKSKTEQTVELRVEQCDDAEKPESDDDEDTEEESSEEPKEPMPAEKPGKALASKLTSSSSDLGY